MKKTKRFAHLKRYLPLYLMILPGVLYLFINNYMPIAGLILAFKKINYSVGLFKSPWVGLENFTYLFKTKDAFLIFRNTILYNLAFIIFGNILGVFTAIALDGITKKYFRKFCQTVILIPFLLSTVIISYIAFAFLSNSNGFINNSILKPLGAQPINWYGEAKYWPVILVIVFLWMSFGYSSILYYAAIIGIDKTYYEAAVVDGARIWQQIRYITLPGLKPTIIILVLLAVGKICYSDLGLFYQIPMNSGLLYSTTNTIDTYVFRGLLQLNDVGRSTSAGFLQSILGFILVLSANAVVKKIERDSALF